MVVHTPVVGYRLIARDADGDSQWDLILESLSFEPVAILLNDGGGHFHQTDLAPYRRMFPRHERTSFQAPVFSTPLKLAVWAPPNPAIQQPRNHRAELSSRNNAIRHAISVIVADPSNAYTRGPPLY